MKKTILIFFASFTLCACADDTTNIENPKTAKVKGNTVAEMTKNGPNVTTRQAKDAWFVHRITSLTEKNNYGRTDCYLNGEFENLSDDALYLAQVKYRTVLIKNPPEGATDDLEVAVQVAPEYGKPNLNPLRSGEIRPTVMGPFYLACEAFEKIKLTAFVAIAVNADGTAKYRSVKDGAPALIIDNQTDFSITRDQD